MIIECPNCHTKFKVKDELIPPEGRKVKCSKCGNVFLAKKQIEEEVFDLSDKVPTEPEKKLEKELEKVAERYKRPAPKKIKKKEDKTNRALYLITLLMLIFAISFSGIYLYIKTKHTSPPFTFMDLKGNFYENKNYGTILVVEGKVKNNWNMSFTKIKIKVDLYDNRGEKIGSTTTYLGNIFSKEELLNLNEKQLQALIYEQVVLKPGATLPFMAIFFHPPKISYSFQATILDYQVLKRK